MLSTIWNMLPKVRKPSIRLFECTQYPLVGFSGEESWPLGEIPLEVTIREGPLTITKTLTFVIIRSDSPHNLLLGRTAMQEMGIIVSIVHGAIKFHTPNGIGTIFSEHNSQRSMEEEGNLTNNGQGDAKDILSCIDTKEKIVIDDEYPEQKTTTHITRVPRTLIIREETFSTEHQLNVFNHTESVKQKKRSLAPERNKVIRTQVEELVEAGVLREVKYQMWVSNLIIVKKDDGKWKLRIDFTNINKACTREPYPLPAAELGAKNLHKYRLKCFLDAYKGYHQIPMAEKDEEKIAFFTREGVFCYKRLPFGLKNTGATYQRLIDKVFGSQIGRNIEVNADEMVIKSDSEEEMLSIMKIPGDVSAINLKPSTKKMPFLLNYESKKEYIWYLIYKQA
ncbi:reverse transcriptase domain-containing protein [Tanacetum coccineum]